MDDRKMEIISQLMEELQDMMGHSSDDLGERLGRPKPDVQVMSLDSDDPMGDDDMDSGMDDDMGSPEDKLKARLMKMRG
jgi:hypothetical protein